MTDLLDEFRLLMQDAAETFRDYESQHILKGGPNCEKAKRNADIAKRLEHAVREMKNGITPKWSDAPDWANFLAKDSDGRWHWYENRPDQDIESWIVSSPFSKNRYAFAGVVDHIDWCDSLSENPKLRHVTEILKPTSVEDK